MVALSARSHDGMSCNTNFLPKGILAPAPTSRRCSGTTVNDIRDIVGELFPAKMFHQGNGLRRWYSLAAFAAPDGDANIAAGKAKTGSKFVGRELQLPAQSADSRRSHNFSPCTFRLYSLHRPSPIFLSSVRCRAKHSPSGFLYGGPSDFQGLTKWVWLSILFTPPDRAPPLAQVGPFRPTGQTG